VRRTLEVSGMIDYFDVVETWDSATR
jgi:hypothetical protein